MMMQAHRNPGNRSSQWLAMILVWFGLIETFTIAISLTRTPISQTGGVAIFLAACTLACLYGYFLTKKYQPNPEDLTNSTPLQKFSKIFIGLVLAIYFLLWGMAYLLPDTGFDGLWYHGPTMHFWETKGYIHWIDGGENPWGTLISQRFNGWPKSIETMGFLLVRATGISRLLNAFNLIFLPLGMFSIYCLARMFRAKQCFSIMAGCLFMLVPVNIVLSLTTLIDTAVACCYIALFAMLSYTIRKIIGGTLPWILIPPLGCILGLCIGAKGPGIILLPTVLLIFLIIFASLSLKNKNSPRQQNPNPRSFLLSPETYFSRALLFLFLLLTVTIMVGGYWHLRNLINTGSPLHPLGLSLYGHEIFPGIGINTINPPPYAPGTETWSQTQRVFYSWLDNLAGWREAIAGKDPKSGGLGLLWIMGCLPAVGIVLARFLVNVLSREKTQRVTDIAENLVPFSMVAGVTVLLFFAMPTDHNHKARYIIWIYGLGLSCLALVTSWIYSSKNRMRKYLGMGWLGICLGIFLFQGIYCLNRQINLLCYYYRSGSNENTDSNWLSKALSNRYPTTYFWEDLSGSAFEYILYDQKPILIGPMRIMAQPLLGLLTQYQDYGRRNIYFFESSMLSDPEQFKKFIKTHSIRYAIWDEGMIVPPQFKPLIILEEPAGRYFHLMVFDPR